MSPVTQDRQRLNPQVSWRDEDDATEAAFSVVVPLTKEQAQDLRSRQWSPSPWHVVGLQACVGLVGALFLVIGLGQEVWAWSFLYGAAVVVVPGALMAWGITGPLSRAGASAGVVNFFVWEAVKVGVSVAMLLLAPVLLQVMSWPALLVSLVLCIKCYWVALLWRGPKKN